MPMLGGLGILDFVLPLHTLGANISASESLCHLKALGLVVVSLSLGLFRLICFMTFVRPRGPMSDFTQSFKVVKSS